MSDVKKNKRVFTRAPFHTEADLHIQDRKIDCILLNIALKGVLIEVPDTSANLEKGAKVKISIKLRATEITICAEGTIVHLEGDQVGIRFDSIDIESMIHLRKVLEYNSDSVEKIESELFFLSQ